MQVKTVKISELKPHPKNPRVHPDSAIEKLERSIKEFGWTNPILVSADGYILASHARLKAAEKAGIEEVPVIYLPLEGAKAEAYLIADNRLQDETDWDYEKLKDLLQELDTGELDLELTGFDVGEIEDLIAQLHVPEEIVEDEVPEPPEEPITKPGDLWILGRHRLLCGDATKKEDVERLMDGKKADMVFADPPYNIAYEGGSKKREMIKNDKIDDFYNFLYDAYANCFEYMKNGSPIYICHNELERVNFTKAFEDVGFKMSSIIIWAKNNSTFSINKDYKQKHEPIIYGWKQGANHTWVGGTCEDTLWEINRPSKSDLHPTMKPIELVARSLTNSSYKDALVYDPFGGSGSTLIACEQLKKICYMMELDPIYCDVIVQRYINLKGHDGDVYLERDGNKIAFSSVT